MDAHALSDNSLIERLHQRVHRERDCVADVLEDLAEVDARKLYITHACSSLSAYCMEVLGYAEHESYPRVAAARVIQRFPKALEMLRDGRVSLTVLRLIDSHLTAEHGDGRLEAVAGRSVRDVQVLIATWAPKPDAPTTVTFAPAKEPPRLLERMVAAAAITSDPLQAATEAPATNNITAPPLAPLASHTPFSSLTPLTPSAIASAVERPAPLPKPISPGKRTITITIDEDDYVALMRLRDVDRHHSRRRYQEDHRRSRA